MVVLGHLLLVGRRLYLLLRLRGLATTEYPGKFAEAGRVHSWLSAWRTDQQIPGNHFESYYPGGRTFPGHCSGNALCSTYPVAKRCLATDCCRRCAGYGQTT